MIFKFICHNDKMNTENKSGTDKFIERAIKKHGQKYNYDKTIFINSRTNLIITCKQHGDFSQNPFVHLRGSGCKQCIDTGLSFNEFVKKANILYENKYEYDNANYKNKSSLIKIKCSQHGLFEKTAEQHLKGRKCPKCKTKRKEIIKNHNNKLLSNNEFIDKANKQHNNFYDYNKTRYLNWRSDIVVTCPNHGDFTINAGSHAKGKGCLSCNDGTKKYTTEKWIEKAKEKYGNKYDYSKSIYRGTRKPIIIICKEHGEFTKWGDKHLSNDKFAECNKCVEKKNWLKKCEDKYGDKFNYSKVNYINNRTRVIIICNEHGDFEQSPDCHLMNMGCMDCVNKTEKIVYDWLLKKFIDKKIIRQKKFEWCKSFKNKFFVFDFYLPELNCIIEIDGRQHFEQVKNWENYKYNQKKDIYKMQVVNKKNISILRIFQEDIYKYGEVWLDKKLHHLIKKYDIVENHYISSESNKHIYDEHKKMYDDKFIFTEQELKKNNFIETVD